MSIVEVNWKKITKGTGGIPLYLARHGDEWLIASISRPKFCFAASSRVDAIEIAKRGIKFWRLATSIKSGEDNTR